MEVIQNKGIITAAFGHRKWIELAVDFALSCYEFNDLEVALVTDQTSSNFILKNYPNIFSHIFISEKLGAEEDDLQVTAKISALEHSPFKKSVFFDADMLFIKKMPINLFNQINQNILMLGRYHDLLSCESLRHNGHEIKHLLNLYSINKYLHCVGGCFFWEKKQGEKYAKSLSEILLTYKNKLKLYNNGLFTDEILFGLTAHGYGVEILELKKGKPWNEMTEKIGLNIRESQFLFHSNFIKYSQILKLIIKIYLNRRKRKISVLPILFWLEELLERRSNEGKSIYFWRFLVHINKKLLD